MTNRISLLIFLAIAGGNCFAQQMATDSLQSLLVRHPSADTIRLNLLNELAFEYSFTNPEKGLETAGKAIVLAEKLNNSPCLARARSRKGMNLAALGQDSLALLSYRKSLELYQELGRRSDAGRILHNIGLVYFGRSEYSKAIEAHRNARNIFKETGEINREGHSANSIGVNLMYLADYPGALEQYLEALTLFEQTTGENTGNINNVFNNLGITYKNLGEWDKAIEWYEKALDLNEKAGRRIEVARVLSNLGTVYSLQNDTARAREFYQNALAINRQQGNIRGIASDLTNLGILSAENHVAALEHFRTALPLYRQLNDRNSLSIVLGELGNLYAAAAPSVLMTDGIEPAERLTAALGYLQESLALAEATGALDRQYEAWNRLSTFYEQQGEFGKALNAHRQFTRLKDSVHTVANAREIARREMQYQMDKNAAIADARLRRQQLAKNAVIGGALLLLLAAASGIALYKKKRDADARQKEADFRARVSETEMKALRAQMNPHFIFNSLNAISDYILKNNASMADEYLGKFSKLMRMVLEHSELQEIPLADDLKALELYLDLEAMRLNWRFNFEILISDEIDPENTLIPPLLMQPFVENSIRHGLTQKEGMGKITIGIRREEQMLVCSIADNGIGLRRSKAITVNSAPHGKRSLGIKITQSRIDILSQHRHAPATMKLVDAPEGTVVELKLPLALNF